ncbi:leucine-rich repeat domain-containing protein [Methylosoma difficile]
MSELALKLIAENKKTRAKFLDLGNCGLTSVPEELGELVWLEELSFSGEWKDEGNKHKSQNKGKANSFRGLSSLRRLSNLKKLWLNYPRVSNLSPLQGLTALQSLTLKSSQLIDLSPLQGLEDLQSLDVSHTQVIDLSPLQGLAALQSLDVSETKVSDLSPLQGLAALQTLDVSFTPVSDLSPLQGLVALQTLYVSHTQVSDLSPLQGLAALQTLVVLDTQVSDLSPLQGLAALQTLDVTNTKVSDLSPLQGLTALQTLNVSHAQVSDLSPLQGLAALQTLVVWDTQVSDLSPLQGLAALQMLEVSHTPVSDLSPLQGLAALQTLEVSFTPVSDLSPLQGLAALQTLDVSFTPVSDLSPLQGLVALQTLYVSHTQVSDLSPLLPLIKQGIPVKWDSWEGGICVEDCPLTNPPVEIVRQGNAAILRYFAEKERSGTIKVREAKLLLVGQGKAGKTTLKRKLHDPHAELPAPGDSTRGIVISHLDETMPQTGEPLRINVWDFGGQDIQHYAHQFFLTGNSLYALVTNERIQDAVHLPYWLNIIEMLGKKSPVILVQNKDGGHCQPLLNEAAIRARFGNVHNRVFQTDLAQAASEQVFADLHKEIVHQAALLPHVEREYLASFAELRKQLEALADKEENFLRWGDYLQLMPELSEELLRDYANAFTFLGVCQYFPHDASLRDYVFLRPKWIIDALFSLLLHPTMEAKRGHFTENDTFEIWQGKKFQGMRSLLVRMMEEFELCYRVTGESHTFILPQQLPSENKSYGWDNQGNTPVRYEYKFMPKGILTRLICRLHPRIANEPTLGQRVWRDAVIFTLPNNKGRVFVREVYAENIIELRAAGEKREEMLNEVIRTMDDINKDSKYDNLQVEKLVPCPCVECAKAEEPGFHEFDALQKRIDKGKVTSECKKSGEDVPIDEIFGVSGVKRPELRQRSKFYGEWETMTVPLKIFISYSKHDVQHKDMLLKHLSGLRGKIITWNDQDLLPGEEWDTRIKAELGKADVVLYLVSAHSMATDYIQNVELPLVEARCQAEECKLAPVIVDFCDWTELNFAKYNALPNKGVPVLDKQWQNENEAWLNVVAGVKRLIAS